MISVKMQFKILSYILILVVIQTVRIDAVWYQNTCHEGPLDRLQVLTFHSKYKTNTCEHWQSQRPMLVFAGFDCPDGCNGVHDVTQLAFAFCVRSGDGWEWNCGGNVEMGWRMIDPIVECDVKEADRVQPSTCSLKYRLLYDPKMDWPAPLDGQAIEDVAANVRCGGPGNNVRRDRFNAHRYITNDPSKWFHEPKPKTTAFYGSGTSNCVTDECRKSEDAAREKKTSYEFQGVGLNNEIDERKHENPWPKLNEQMKQARGVVETPAFVGDGSRDTIPRQVYLGDNPNVIHRSKLVPIDEPAPTTAHGYKTCQIVGWPATIGKGRCSSFQQQDRCMKSKTIIVDAQGIEMFMLVDPDAEPVKVPNEIQLIVSTGKDGVIFQSPPPTVIGMKDLQSPEDLDHKTKYEFTGSGVNNVIRGAGSNNVIHEIRKQHIDLDQEELIIGKIVHGGEMSDDHPRRFITASRDNVINHKDVPYDYHDAHMRPVDGPHAVDPPKVPKVTLDQLIESMGAMTVRRV